MPAATASWSAPPPESPKATNPVMGFTRSKGGEPSEGSGSGAVVVVLVGPALVGAVVVDEDDTAPSDAWRVEVQAVSSPAPRSPSICRRESGTAAMLRGYRWPDQAPPGQSGKSGGMARPEDEHRRPPGSEPEWADAWEIDFAADDGPVGGY